MKHSCFEMALVIVTKRDFNITNIIRKTKRLVRQNTSFWLISWIKSALSLEEVGIDLSICFVQVRNIARSLQGVIYFVDALHIGHSLFRVFCNLE